jgi:hypothetical protein
VNWNVFLEANQAYIVIVKLYQDIRTGDMVAQYDFNVAMFPKPGRRICFEESALFHFILLILLSIDIYSVCSTYSHMISLILRRHSCHPVSVCLVYRATLKAPFHALPNPHQSSKLVQYHVSFGSDHSNFISNMPWPCCRPSVSESLCESTRDDGDAERYPSRPIVTHKILALGLDCWSIEMSVRGRLPQSDPQDAQVRESLLNMIDQIS